jgi:hypothetical protein
MSGKIDLTSKLEEFYDGVLVGNQSSRGRKVRGFRAVPASQNNGASSGVRGGSKSEAARQKLRAMVSGIPEVMVKVTGGGKGMREVRNHLDYVSRNGELTLEDQNGDSISGKDDVHGLASEWQSSGSYVAEEGTCREAFNIVLSMPPGTDRLAVERAGRDFAKREFQENFQYVFVCHDDEDHPHVHLVVKARGFDGMRLNPRKADLHRWRESFASALGENGVEAVATKRQQRLKREKGLHQAVAHMVERGEVPTSQGAVTAPERVDRAKKTEETVRRGYNEIIEALGQSTPADRKLAAQLSAKLLGQDVAVVDRVQDSGRE